MLLQKLVVRKETPRSIPAWCPQEGRGKGNNERRKEGGKARREERKIVMWVTLVHSNYSFFFFGPCVWNCAFISILWYLLDFQINQCNWRTAVYHCGFNLYFSHQHWTSSHILLMYHLWQDCSCLLFILSVWFLSYPC